MSRVITVVSGLPRSGTSMLMRMLDAGGLATLADDTRPADEDNPGGYYELDAVRRSRHDTAWIAAAPGKAVKVIYKLLRHLPSDHEYRVLYLRRDIDEVIASQERMLERRGEQPAGTMTHEQLAAALTAEWQRTWEWLQEQPNFRSLLVDYNRLLGEPEPLVEQICTFLGGDLDRDAMLAVVDPTLYRQRRTSTRA